MTGSTAEKHDSFLAPTGEGQTDRRVLRQEPRPGRAGCELVPVGRHPRDVRGARLHRLGRDLADLPAGRAERRDPDHPDRVRLLHRRGARPQDPAAPLAGGARQAGAAHPRAGSATRAPSRVFTNIGPEQEYFLVDRRLAEQRPDLLLTGRTLFGAAVAQGPGAGGPVLRPDPRADPRLHDGPRPRAVAAWHPGQDPPQRGRAGAVRDGAGVRGDVGRLGPQHARHVARCAGSRRTTG